MTKNKKRKQKGIFFPTNEKLICLSRSLLGTQVSCCQSPAFLRTVYLNPELSTASVLSYHHIMDKVT